MVPTFSIVLQGVWASLLTLMGSFDRFFSYVIFVCWIFYGLGVWLYLCLRRKQPELDRPYKTWGYPFVPLLFALMRS